MFLLRSLCLLVIPAASMLAADTPAAIYERQLKNMEGEVVSLAEAMPADKFHFAPTNGEFKGVRTFAQQAKHVAFVMNQISSTLLGEKNPSAGGSDENGPPEVQSKEQVVKYLKDAFTYAHRAVATLTAANLLEETADPFSPSRRRTRLDSANAIQWHTFDHYGQMVEYLRMNHLVPPASR